MSIRRRLTIGVTAIVLGCLAVAFAAVYAGTGGEVRTQLDDDLNADMEAFTRVVAVGPSGIRAAATAFVDGQPYAPNARLLYARLPNAPVPVTNDRDLVTPNKADPDGERARRILGTPPGARDVDLPDGRRIRLLVRRVRTATGVVTLGVGESTRLVDRAQDGVLRSFLTAGGLAVVLAALAAVVLATRIAGPLRRMAGVAARIQEGDLGRRMAQGRTAGEGDDVTVLGDAFDSMLDRLQAAFDRQNAFVADASHELRTPLTVIQGQLEVLALDANPPGDEVRRVQRLVRTEVVRMNRMVDDLLMLTRAQDDGFLRPSAVALPALTRDLLEAQRATAERDFRHESDVAGVLQADPDRLAQAIRNLLRNAIEHTADGGLVSLWTQSEPGGWIVIGVDDDGPGIPEDERDRVFGRFHRADARGPRGSGTGTGLGLAIVQAIAAAHGGTVAAQASPAGGARVVLRLPQFAARAG
ncbi:hypothetical protein DSM112329_02159 [Paraconexibacter sp. AEG42_29]|uniref:histidine kinase n=1 Tax=Paraconexibacter sp. AEG42_29 TaxID=2997339 RepID=A0AAU7AUM7_9ACTN